LPKDCGSMPDNDVTPRPKTFWSNFLCEGQLGAWQQANRNVVVLGRRKAVRACTEIANR